MLDIEKLEKEETEVALAELGKRAAQRLCSLKMRADRSVDEYNDFKSKIVSANTIHELASLLGDRS